MVLKTGNEDMEKIHLHSQTREKAVIAAVKVVVDIISEGDQDAEPISEMTFDTNFILPTKEVKQNGTKSNESCQ